MLNFNREFAGTCSSNVHWEKYINGSNGELYHVIWGLLTSHEQERQTAQCGWTCTCKAFKFRKHDSQKPFCKHIREVEHERCSWNAHLDPGLRCNTEGECPGCGEKVYYIPVAV